MAGELFRTEAMGDVQLVIERNSRPANATASQYDAHSTGTRHAFQEVTVLMGENAAGSEHANIVLRHRHSYDGIRWAWHQMQPARTRLLHDAAF
jgi:hypothetical protein